MYKPDKWIIWNVFLYLPIIFLFLCPVKMKKLQTVRLLCIFTLWFLSFIHNKIHGKCSEIAWFYGTLVYYHNVSMCYKNKHWKIEYKKYQKTQSIITLVILWSNTICWYSSVTRDFRMFKKKCIKEIHNLNWNGFSKFIIANVYKTIIVTSISYNWEGKLSGFNLHQSSYQTIVVKSII